jgi:hypothetical protein
MLALELQNPKRTGDLTDMTISEFLSCRMTKTAPEHHKVLVLEHKTATSTRCPAHFHGDEKEKYTGGA